MKPTPEEIHAGHSIYTPHILALYDFGVLMLSNSFLWRCPTKRLLYHFNQNVTANHLDIGVGSGFFLDKCYFQSHHPRIGIMDLNPEAIKYTVARIGRYNPEQFIHNILEPVDFLCPKFDSISLNYLLHCLPGSLTSKSIIIDHVQSLANPGAICFGSTLLGDEVSLNWGGKHLMSFYNKQGIFSNRNDNARNLEIELSKRLDMTSFEIVGSVALFSGRYLSK